MTATVLSIGLNRYDHVRALFDGTVTIDGVDARFEDAPIVSDIFERMVLRDAYDVAELGLTYYLRALGRGDTRFVALPVFPNRHFRHSSIWVSTSSGIREPSDLVGKTIGELATYGHDAGIWPKGILGDDYGYRPEGSRWIIGGTDWPISQLGYAPLLHPPGVDVQYASAGKLLGPMLETGEIDALISAVVPQCVLNNSPKVTTLFPDPEAAERDYYRRTGIYPIMHTVVIRRELAEQRPELPRAIYRAFCKSRDVALANWEHGRMDHHMNWMVPWLSPLYERNHSLLAADSWAHGVAANRKTIETFTRYMFEQGIAERHYTCEEMFIADLLDT